MTTVTSIHELHPGSTINDIREQGEFKGISFSNFKKSEVKQQLLMNISKGKVEPACYWSVELICSGHFIDLWDIIISYSSKMIHIGNPKIAMYLDMRYQAFREIANNRMFRREIDIRNSPAIRKLFAEVICILCVSNKKHSFETIKIHREEEYDITQMSEKLKAPTTIYGEACFQHDDPKELFIAMNELSYNISVKNTIQSCYWIEWIIDFDSICKKRKQPCICTRRPGIPVSPKYQMDVVWMIWDIFFEYGEKTEFSSFITRAMKSLLNLFCICYTTAVCKRRRHVLYFAVSLLTETIDPNIELIGNKTSIETAVEKVDHLYKQVKKNEWSPNTDYLFTNMDKRSNFEKTVRRLEMLSTMEFVPRTTNMGASSETL